MSTSLGPVEVALSGPSRGAVVLVFPGGHATAATPLGSDLYTDLGYRVLAFSRPGYGRTSVGPLMAAEFVPAVAEVCDELGITEAAATVGVSFGGLQAALVAVSLEHLAPRLVLHSCAPSTLPYPDTRLEAAVGPLGFSPRTQRLTWRAIRAMTSSDRGLRLMMSTLSTVPVDSWWQTWTPADRASARATFAAMDSGSGFVTDVRQGSRGQVALPSHDPAVRSVPDPGDRVPQRWRRELRPRRRTSSARSHTPASSRPMRPATSTGSAQSDRPSPPPSTTSWPSSRHAQSSRVDHHAGTWRYALPRRPYAEGRRHRERHDGGPDGQTRPDRRQSRRVCRMFPSGLFRMSPALALSVPPPRGYQGRRGVLHRQRSVDGVLSASS